MQHTTAAGPLKDIRILDLSSHFSGPFGTCVLADQGADVIKIEQPGYGDGTRYQAPMRNNLSATFAAINRNKRSLALDLRTKQGAAVLAEMIRQADVLVQNYRPGVMERLGFSYAEVRRLNPAIVYLSVSGFGPDGPYANRRAYDLTIQALSGLADIQGGSSGIPDLVRTSVCDKLTGLLVAQGIASALCARERDPERRGRHVRIAMLDAAVWFLWPDGMLNHTFPDDGAPEADMGEYYRLRETRDGYLMVAMISQQEFEGVCRVLGVPELADDPRFASQAVRSQNLAALNAALAPLFAGQDQDDLFGRLLAADVPVAKVSSRSDVLSDPQLAHRGTIGIHHHPHAGAMRQARHPIEFGSDSPAADGPAPLLGEQSEDILHEFGFSPAQINTLRRDNIIG